MDTSIGDTVSVLPPMGMLDKTTPTLVTSKRDYQTNRLLLASHKYPYHEVLQQMFSLKGILRSDVLAQRAYSWRPCPLAMGSRRE